jgi:NADH:ubiquinone oxidoreductase subunit 2 (subunit N)
MLVAIVTMLVGNLFALRQQNIKRFLAFSSIAQVGFILVGISSNSPVGTSAVVYFVLLKRIKVNCFLRRRISNDWMCFPGTVPAYYVQSV